MKTTETMIKNVFRRINEYEMEKKTRQKKALKAVAGSLCVCVIATVILVGVSFVSNHFSEQGNYRIELDVNPSIEISVDKNDRVLSVSSRNDDAVAVIGDNSFEGDNVGETVEDMITSMIELGYISEEANSVLVSVDADEEKNAKISAELSERISNVMSDDDLEGAILVQTVALDSEELKNISEQYAISPGKAQLICQIIQQNSSHTYEELAGLTINELNILRTTYYVELKDVQISGNASQMAYIGADRAEEITFAHSQIEKSNAKELTANLECRSGVMLYRVEFEWDVYQYRYRINAVTGEVLSSEKINVLAGEKFLETEQDNTFMGENAALNAALSHADIQNKRLIRCKYKMDWVDGLVVYEINFSDGEYACEYVMNARTGEIIKYGKTQQLRNTGVGDSLIGEAAAKNIALAKDGLIDGSITKYQMVLEKADGIYVYNIEYICSGSLYKAVINATDGTVVQFEKRVLK